MYKQAISPLVLGLTDDVAAYSLLPDQNEIQMQKQKKNQAILAAISGYVGSRLKMGAEDTGMFHDYPPLAPSPSAPPQPQYQLPNAMQLQQQQYMGLNARRQFSPSEQSFIDKRKTSILPKIFQSYADSPAVKMFSPTTEAVGTGALGAAGGGLLGSMVSDSKAAPIIGALLCSGKFSL